LRDKQIKRPKPKHPAAENRHESRPQKTAGKRRKSDTPQRLKAAANHLPHQPAPSQPKPAAEAFAFPQFGGALPREAAPLILTTEPDADYALLDLGSGRKLERYGAYRIIRPEGQALTLPSLPAAEWAKADAIFTGNLEEEGVGRWQFPQAEKQAGADAQPAETWPMRWRGLPYLGRFTSFRHVGVFPEQTAHWLFMEQLIANAVQQGRTPRVLNLFGYTGLASLIAARAGAEVTHIDASKKAIGWGQENQIFAEMSHAPIRWICEDALKFMAREERRGSSYDIILLDPPAYGRGPKGEVWQFFDNIAELAVRARRLLSPQPLAVILTAYSIRASFYALHMLMREAFRGKGGKVESGELIIKQETAAGITEPQSGSQEQGAPGGVTRPRGGAGQSPAAMSAETSAADTPRQLSTSLFSRWVSDYAEEQK